MGIEIVVPALGETVTEATVGQWFKQPGDAVNADEPVLELETDKVTLEVPAPASGVLADIKVPQGTTVAVGSVLGPIREGAAEGPSAPKPKPPPPLAATRLAEAPAAPATPRTAPGANGDMPPAPAARKLMEEKGIS